MIKYNSQRFFQYLSFFVICFLFVSNAFADGYKIKLKATNVQDTTMLLAYHLGHKIFIQDTAVIDKKGIATFEGEEALPPGIYLGVYSGSRYFEFLVPSESDAQKFSIEVDTTDFVNSMKVSDSEENVIFNDYQRFLSKQGKTIQEMKEALKEIPETDKEAQKAKQTEINKAEKVIFDYRKTLMKERPDSYTAFLFRCMEEVTPPKKPTAEAKAVEEEGVVEGGEDVSVGDAVEEEEENPFFAFYYIKNHFWDGFSFSDNRILRTPIFHSKIEKFLETYTPKHPDSINVAADIIIENAKANDELFKYALGYITQKYQQSKIMGMEGVFVHLAANYYLKGQADWITDKQKEQINERYQKLRYNLLGMKARNMKLQDMEGQMVSMHDVEASYLMVLFWDYKCGNCKKRMPEITKLYNKYKDKGFKVYAVCTRSEVDKWKGYLKGKDFPFIHVIDPQNKSNFRQVYDIYSTPTVYLLDENKEIVAKRLGEEQFDSMLERFYADKEVKAEKTSEGK